MGTGKAIVSKAAEQDPAEAAVADAEQDRAILSMSAKMIILDMVDKSVEVAQSQLRTRESIEQSEVRRREIEKARAARELQMEKDRLAREKKRREAAAKLASDEEVRK